MGWFAWSIASRQVLLAQQFIRNWTSSFVALRGYRRSYQKRLSLRLAALPNHCTQLSFSFEMGYDSSYHLVIEISISVNIHYFDYRTHVSTIEQCRTSWPIITKNYAILPFGNNAQPPYVYVQLQRVVAHFTLYICENNKMAKGGDEAKDLDWRALWSRSEVVPRRLRTAKSITEISACKLPFTLPGS